VRVAAADGDLCRAKLFSLINQHPTLFEVVTGQVKPNNGKPAPVQPHATAGSKRKEGVMVSTALVFWRAVHCCCLRDQQCRSAWWLISAVGY